MGCRYRRQNNMEMEGGREMSQKVSANKAKFNGDFDMFLSRGYLQSQKFTVCLKRNENLVRRINEAEPNQLLWDCKRKKLYFLNCDGELFRLDFSKVKKSAKCPSSPSVPSVSSVVK